MKELYYPSFEITDEKWLKYAILYKENVSTIVPIYYRKGLSDSFKTVKRSTDLLDFYDVSRENFEILVETANIVLQYLADIKKRPQSYKVQSYWKKFDNLDEILMYGDRNYTLVNQKVNHIFESRLIEMNYAKKVNDGIKVHYILGYFYMSILAYKITGTENDLVATTDINVANINKRIFNDYLPVMRTPQDYFERDTVKQLIINQSMPKLEELSIEKAIEIRNKRSYRKNLSSFNKVIENIINIDSEHDLDLKEIDRQLTFYSDEMAGIRRDTLRDVGLVIVECALSLYCDSLPEIIGGEILRKMINTNDGRSEIKLKDVYRTKRIITNLKKA